MPTDSAHADACRRLGVPAPRPHGYLVPWDRLLDEIAGSCECAAVVADSGHCTGCGELVAVPINQSEVSDAD